MRNKDFKSTAMILLAAAALFAYTGISAILKNGFDTMSIFWLILAVADVAIAISAFKKDKQQKKDNDWK